MGCVYLHVLVLRPRDNGGVLVRVGGGGGSPYMATWDHRSQVNTPENECTNGGIIRSIAPQASHTQDLEC